METIYGLLIAWFMSSAALGVGSSTLAVASFLVAVKDGAIDMSERRMLGVIYFALRSSTVMIIISLLLLELFFPAMIETAMFIWALVAVLVINSILMTLHYIPPQLGPAIQAATWYTLGFVLAIEAFELIDLTWLFFSLLYAGDLILALVIVNALLWWFTP